MGIPNLEKQQWLDALRLMSGGVLSVSDQDTSAGEASSTPNRLPSQDRLYADSRHANVHLGVMPDDDPRDRKDVNLPKVTDDVVEVVEHGSKQKTQMKRSEVWSSPEYINNEIEKLKAQPTITTLTVKEMELIYSGGRSLMVQMSWIKFGTDPQPDSYTRKDGFIIPVNQAGKVLFDINNTPNIVRCAEWVQQEIARRLQQRVEIAELVNTFAGAIADLGHAAADNASLVGPPTEEENETAARARARRNNGNPEDESGPGSGTKGTKTGEETEDANSSSNSSRDSNGPANTGNEQTGRTDSGTPDGPPSNGDSSNEGAGGAPGRPQLKTLSAQKQEQHTYFEDDVHQKPGKSEEVNRANNQRIDRHARDAQNETELHASMLNKKYADPAMRSKIQTMAQAKIDSGQYTALNKGGYQIKLDLGEQVGWQNQQPTQIIEIRISTKGVWHFFPSQ